MLGAIIGDIVGSYLEVEEIKAKKLKKVRDYPERIKILDKNVTLFNDSCSYTDDSVLTTAIAAALCNNKDYEFYLKKYGLQELSLGLDKYGRKRFSPGFIHWLTSNEQGTSLGNGAAMRVSPIAYYFNNLNEIEANALKATVCSHNHGEAVSAVLAVCDCIYMLRKRLSKEDIKSYLQREYSYNLNLDLTNLQKNYSFSAKAQDTIPPALFCFLLASDFEDALRKALSIGGDSDTIACIVGSISEACFEIPDYMFNELKKFIPLYMQEIILKYYERVNTFQSGKILKMMR